MMNQTKTIRSMTFRTGLVAGTALVTIFAAGNQATAGDVAFETIPWDAMIQPLDQLAESGMIDRADETAAYLGAQLSDEAAVDMMETVLVDGAAESLEAEVPQPANPSSMADADPAVETPVARRLEEFEQLAAVDTAELDDMRGGFSLGGIVMRIGLDITNVLNGVTTDRIVTLSPAVIGGSSPNSGQFRNENTGETFGINNLPNGGNIVSRSANGGKTNMQITLNNGLRNLVQNSANNQNIQQKSGLNIEVSGLSGLLRTVMGNAGVLGALQHGNRRHR